MERTQLAWSRLEDEYYGKAYPQAIQGYSCAICGAAVTIGSQRLHIEWHELLRTEVQKAVQAGVNNGYSPRW